MRPDPRQVCPAEGSDTSGRGDGVSGNLDISRSHFAPEAADAIRRQVIRFTNYRCAVQSVNEYFAECDLLRRMAESEMATGAGFREESASILCAGFARLSRREKSAEMRRLSGSRGGGGRQDSLFTGEATEARAGDEDLDDVTAYAMAEKQGASRDKEDGSPKRRGDKARGSGQTLDCSDRKTGLRNRRYRRDCEYHLASRCPWRDTPRGDGSPFFREREGVRRPFFCSILTETPVLPLKAESAGDGETRSKREQSFDATVDAGDLFLAPQEDCGGVGYGRNGQPSVL